MEVEKYQTQDISEPVGTGRKSSGLLRFATDVLETFVLAAFLFFVINALSARIRVDGSSMEPTLHNGELVIVDKVSYQIWEPGRGDVIVFHYPRNPEKEYIKRIIGLPGDRVDILNGQVYINGEAILEPYIAAAPTYPGNWTVNPDSFFVLGDNRNNSDDSHRWGTVPVDYVIGKAILVYWPPEEWGLIEHHAYAAP
jgi:signal peptidase I